MKRFSLILFAAVSLLELCAELFGLSILKFVTKPLLMTTLLGYFTVSLGKTPINQKYQMFAALIFSWAGDVALMLAGGSPNLFLVGLVCFLIAHICYIVIYSRVTGNQPSLLKRKPVYFASILLYIGCFLWLLIPSLLCKHETQAFSLPVTIYSVVIATMTAFALNREGLVNPLSFRFVLTGAILFTLSDSVIALNKFLTPVPQAGFIIMSTYILGQFLIVQGILTQYNLPDK